MKTLLCIQTIPLCIMLSICSFNSQAEDVIEHTTQNIMIPLAQKNMHSEIKLPSRGDNADKVESEFGKPLKKHSAKGKPPISKWEYAQFTVYFESNYVIHNVVNKAQNKEVIK